MADKDDAAAAAAATATTTVWRLPFSKLVHHPTRDILFLACGGHLQCLDSRSGALLASTIDTTKNGLVCRTTAGPNPDTPHTGIIRTLAISNDGRRLVSSGEDKLLKVWSTERELECLSSRTAQKRIVAVQITGDNKGIVTADKFGDVYLYSVDQGDREPDFVLGHVSMLLDMEISADGKHIITAERDEKIRVSRYPKGYLIDNYCLGHKELVSAILIPPFARDRLLSGGGDPFLVLWDWKSGGVLQMISLLESFGMIKENAHPFVARPIVTSIRASPVNPHVAVALERYPGLLILEWREGRFEVYGLLELPRDPLDVCFDRKGDLWITLSTPENTEQDSSEELLRLYSYANNLYQRVDACDARVSTINRHGSMLVENLPDLYPFRPLRKDIRSWLKGDFPDINRSDREEEGDEEQEDEEEKAEPKKKKPRRGRKKRVV